MGVTHFFIIPYWIGYRETEKIGANRTILCKPVKKRP